MHLTLFSFVVSGNEEERDMVEQSVPKGFYITAAEMRDGGIRVHENIEDHTRFVPPSFEAFVERTRLVKNALEGAEADAKYCIEEGRHDRAELHREYWNSINTVLQTWRNRWKEAVICQ
jgi:hypothetical protein